MPIHIYTLGLVESDSTDDDREKLPLDPRRVSNPAEMVAQYIDTYVYIYTYIYIYIPWG